ncbi:YdbH domain-containing protein [Pelagibius sp.]|uniref:YdbH domain-containing protein n=1 Tax=Pelagibius sp. TaxID=1931238 RepID=UPI00262F5545|nr:YdbH domain-containing protein [Pelagibius sp.]
MADPQREATSKTKRPWPRRPALGLTVLIAAVVLVVLGLRNEIAGGLLHSVLEDRGIAVAALEVEQLSLNRAVLGPLALGDAEELTAERIILDLDVSLTGAEVTAVTVEGPGLSIDLTGQGPLFGSLQAAIDTLRAQDTGPRAEPTTPAVPPVTLSGGRVVAITPQGAMEVWLDGGLERQADGTLAATLAARADSPLGRLAASLQGRLGSTGDFAARAQIDEGEFRWQDFGIGQVAGTLAVARPAGGTPRLNSNLAFEDLVYRREGAPPLTFMQGRLEARGDLSGLTLSARLDGEGETIVVDLDGGLEAADLSGGAATRELAVSLAAEVGTQGALAGLLELPEPAPEQGQLTFIADLRADVPGSALQPRGRSNSWPDATGDALAALMESGNALLHGDLILADVALSDGSGGISAHIPLIADLQGGRVSLRLTDDMELRIESIAERTLASLGVLREHRPVLQSGFSLSVSASQPRPAAATMTAAWPPEDAQVTLPLSFSSEQGVSAEAVALGRATLARNGLLKRFSGTLSTALTAERFAVAAGEARGLDVALPLRVDFRPGRLEASLDGSGSIAVQQIAGPLPLRFKEQTALTITQARVRWSEEDAAYSYRLQARDPSAVLDLITADERLEVGLEDAAFTLDGRFAVDRGHAATAAAKFGRIAIPAYGVTAAEMTAESDLDQDLLPALGRFSIASLTADLTTLPLEAVAVDGELRRAGAGFDLTATIGLADGPALAKLTGRYDDAGTGTARVIFDGLQFSPDGLQPSDISPALADLEEVEGRLTGDATLHWPMDGAPSAGKVRTAGLSFRTQGVGIKGLALDLELDSLMPIASKSDQRLRIGEIDAGAPITEIDLSFGLDQQPDPGVDLSAGSFRLGGAAWRIEPTRLDPAAVENTIALATETLDLATFFALIEVEGLSGSGILVGRIPIRVGEAGVVIDNGKLEAQAPGRLSIRSQALISALSGGGETVELAIRALEDFRYDRLSVTVNKTLANDAQVLLSILGQNPAVLDGQPFQFNINLESNLTSVLEAVRQGFSLSDDALRRAWRLRQ